jgi:hypothetical protein
LTGVHSSRGGDGITPAGDQRHDEHRVISVPGRGTHSSFRKSGLWGIPIRDRKTGPEEASDAAFGQTALRPRHLLTN